MKLIESFKLAITTACLVVTTGFACHSANAAKLPNPMNTDERIKQAVYDPNQVYEIVGTYGFQTSIEFAPDELVGVVTLGDTLAWQTFPYWNRLFIKPVEMNATTNMTVVTDKRTYYFKLDAQKNQNRSAMTFLVRFQYPKIRPNTQGSTTAGFKPGGAFDPSLVNLNYGISGDKSAIQLNRVFDDGQFTFFLFEPNTEIPSVYSVGPDGTESIVNTRRDGMYLVVERTASLFTLRNGNSHLCVQNNDNPYKRTANNTAGSD